MLTIQIDLSVIATLQGYNFKSYWNTKLKLCQHIHLGMYVDCKNVIRWSLKRALLCLVFADLFTYIEVWTGSEKGEKGSLGFWKPQKPWLAIGYVSECLIIT